MSGIDPWHGPGRGATTDGSRAFQHPDSRVSYAPRRGATADGSRGFQPTGMVATFSLRRGATVEAGGSSHVRGVVMRRAATRSVFRVVIRGLKPTATIMGSLRDEEAMPLADDEQALRIQKNLEGFGV